MVSTGEQNTCSLETDDILTEIALLAFKSKPMTYSLKKLSRPLKVIKHRSVLCHRFRSTVSTGYILCYMRHESMMMLQAFLKKQTKIKKSKLSIGNKRLRSSAYIKKTLKV